MFLMKGGKWKEAQDLTGEDELAERMNGGYNSP